MSKQFIAIITVQDGHGYNDLRTAATDFLTGTPEWVESLRISEATNYTIKRDHETT